MGQSPSGKLTQVGMTRVTVASGAVSHPISFPRQFVQIPAILVVPHGGDAGTYSGASVTDSGMTLTLTGSGFADGELMLEWYAQEMS